MPIDKKKMKKNALDINDTFYRSKMILGDEFINSLANKKVAVFGIGGVGGFTCEALIRTGIGNLDLIDNDVVCKSNINRQIIATQNTIGMQKTQLMKKRAIEINPEVNVNTFDIFLDKDTINKFDFSKYDYIIDAIDTVTSKILLAQKAQEYDIPIISCMGAGNKLDPTKFEVTDISKTSVCPLAKVMRRELKKRRIKKLKVVYSKENPIKPKSADLEENSNEKLPPGSVAFVPSVAGLIIAGEVIKDLKKFFLANESEDNTHE